MVLYSQLKTFSKKIKSYFPIENDWGIMESNTIERRNT